MEHPRRLASYAHGNSDMLLEKILALRDECRLIMSFKFEHLIICDDELKIPVFSHRKKVCA